MLKIIFTFKKHRAESNKTLGSVLVNIKRKGNKNKEKYYLRAGAVIPLTTRFMTIHITLFGRGFDVTFNKIKNTVFKFN